MIELEPEEFEKLLKEWKEAEREVANLRQFIEGCAEVMDENFGSCKSQIKQKLPRLLYALKKRPRQQGL